MQLTDRQQRVLRAVVEVHAATRRPVGSKAIVESGAVEASSSTVRYELGRLEDLGLLEHPHTSAGRVPTDAGYRVYVDLLAGGRRGGPAVRIERRGDEPSGDEPGGDAVELEVPPAGELAGARVDDAVRATTQSLAEATSLLAVVTAPRASGAVIRHVEVLQLQPTMLVAVLITAAGDVTRHVVTTERPVDPGLVEWAGEYLNETVTGMAIGQNLLRNRLRSPELGPGERAILALLGPAFSELVDEGQDVHVGGSAALVDALGADVQRVANLVAMLDERRRLLEALRPIVRRTAGSGGVAVQIGTENPLPELRSLSVVGAPYGLAARPLGLVGLIGPRAMDYPHAMSAVQAAAQGLGHVADALYDR